MAKVRTIQLALIALLIGAGIWLAAGSNAGAAPTPIQLTPVVPLDIQPGKPVTLGAKVIDQTTNRAVSNVEVNFYVETDVFGPRLMNVGKAVSDATGAAYVVYKPSWVGDTSVVARVLPTDQFGAAEGKFTFSAVGPARVHEDAAFGLAPVRAVAPFVVITLVLAVWGSLLFTVVYTFRGIALADTQAVPEGRAARRRRAQTAAK